MGNVTPWATLLRLDSRSSYGRSSYKRTTFYNRRPGSKQLLVGARISIDAGVCRYYAEDTSWETTCGAPWSYHEGCIIAVAGIAPVGG